MPSVSSSVADGPNEQSVLNAYNAEGHLRLVEVLLVPLSSDVVISLWQTLDAVSLLYSAVWFCFVQFLATLVGSIFILQRLIFVCRCC